MSKSTYIEYKYDKNNLIFNKVKNIFLFIIIIIIQLLINQNDPTIYKSLLGRKRNLENNRQKTSSKNYLDTNHFSSSKPKIINNITEPKITKEITNLYNIQRSICLKCVKVKNKKYTTNKYIPCISTSASS